MAFGAQICLLQRSLQPRDVCQSFLGVSLCCLAMSLSPSVRLLLPSIRTFLDAYLFILITYWQAILVSAKKIINYMVSCHIICKDYDCKLQYEKALYVWLIQENNIAKGYNVSMIEHNLIFWFWPLFFFFLHFFFIVRAYCIFNIKFFVSRIFKKEKLKPIRSRSLFY